jgi:hypothetical protein
VQLLHRRRLLGGVCRGALALQPRRTAAGEGQQLQRQQQASGVGGAARKRAAMGCAPSLPHLLHCVEPLHSCARPRRGWAVPASSTRGQGGQRGREGKSQRSACWGLDRLRVAVEVSALSAHLPYLVLCSGTGENSCSPRRDMLRVTGGSERAAAAAASWPSPPPVLVLHTRRASLLSRRTPGLLWPAAEVPAADGGHPETRRASG